MIIHATIKKACLFIWTDLHGLEKACLFTKGLNMLGFLESNKKFNDLAQKIKAN